jgi:hypothetical protein
MKYMKKLTLTKKELNNIWFPYIDSLKQVNPRISVQFWDQLWNTEKQLGRDQIIDSMNELLWIY